MNFAELLLRDEFDDRVAVVTRGTPVTYRALRLRVESWSARLLDDGLAPGDCVGILGENSLFWLVAYLSTIYAGGVAVPVAPSSSIESLRTQLDMSQSRRVFAEPKYSDRLRSPALARLSMRVWTDDPGEGGERTTRLPAVSRSADDVAVVNFTSGSTGVPRGVMVSHRNLEANTRSIVSCLGLTREDRALLVLPLFYCFGASVLHTHLAVGGTTVFASSFVYPEIVLEELAASGCTGFYGVPSNYQILLRRSSFTSRQFPALRYMAQAGGRLAPAFIDEIRAAHPGVPFVVMYCQTEATARLSYLPPDLLERKIGSIGRGIPGVELRVLRPDGQPAAVGELGEIVARGDNVTLGYLGDPETTSAYFRDGQLWTGDLAIVDEDGFIFIRDRQRDFIKSGGQRIGSKEVEDVIAELADVVEVAVVGMPHDTLGEAIAAYVVARHRSALTADAVIRHCRSRLGMEKEPRFVEFRTELPKNESGKTMKAALRAGWD